MNEKFSDANLLKERRFLEMTEAINFFQAVYSKNIFSTIGANRAEIRLANALKKDARRLQSEAEVESRNAETAQLIAFDSKTENIKRDFAEIALWHSLMAFGKYRQSAERFSEAAAIETKFQKEFIKNSIKMNDQAVQTQIAICRLTEILS